MTMDLELFALWAISISGGSIFLTLVSIYLYAESRATRRRREQAGSRMIVILEDFAFVWVLLGLLVFYIISVSIGSAAIFAVGNIFVEVSLVLYLIRHRRAKPDQNNHPSGRAT